ncbi:hypothetical protein ACH51_04295 [Ralstonia solanacearum]|nr:hypothetical protein ACH51_04295 [Ralstonia solanacearum]
MPSDSVQTTSACRTWATEPGAEVSASEYSVWMESMTTTSGFSASMVAWMRSSWISASSARFGGSLGVAAAVGDMPIEEVVTALARDSGIEPAEMAQRFSFAQAAFQSQADNFITKHLGIPEGDLQNFYAFVRQPEHKGALQNAIRQQVQGNSMAAYKPLVDSYYANSTPSAAALQANGFEMKTDHDGRELVRIQGQWMPLKVAAKTGLI